MRPRKWVIAIVLIIVAIITALYQVSRYLEKNRNIENLLIQGISPYIKGTFNVEKVRFGLFSAHLQNVTLSVPLNSFSAHIQSIKVGFSFSKMIRFRGDISRSINRVILIGPVIDISILPDSSQISSIPLKAPPVKAVSVPHELPIRNLIVKKGMLRFSDISGDIFILGEKLSGKLTDRGIETDVDLNGKLGSRKNNLSLQGTISWTGEKNRLSVRLNGASIKRPIALKGLVLSAGALSGTVEFTFPDSVSLSNLQADGWVTLKGGICSFGEDRGTIHSADMNMSMSGSQWKVDSLKCQYKGIQADIRGEWNLDRGPSTAFEFLCTDILADSLQNLFSSEIRSKLTGRGWCQGTVTGLAAQRGLEINVSGGGLSAWGVPLSGITAGIRIDSSLVCLDSAVLRNPGLFVSADGTIGFDQKLPDYKLRIAASVDSIPVIPDISGSVRVTGMIQGGADQPKVQLMVTGKGIKYRDFLLGNQEIIVQSKGERISISNYNTRSSTDIRFSAVIEDLLSKSPKTKCLLKIGSAPIFSLLKRNHISRSDSAWMNLNVEGWVDTFNVALETGINFSGLNGVLTGTVMKSKRIGAPIVWKLNQRNMVYNGVEVSVHGRGKFRGDSLDIDSLSVFDGIWGSAKLFLNTKPVHCKANLRYELEIERLLSLLPNSDIQIEKGKLSGISRISGTWEVPEIRSEVHIKNLTAGGLSGLQTDAIVTSLGKHLRILPLVIRKQGRVIAALDTVVHDGEKFTIAGDFEDLDIKSLLGTLIPKDLDIDSRITGHIRSTAAGFPLAVAFTAPSFRIDRWTLDSLSFTGNIEPSGVRIVRLRALDGKRVTVSADGYVPWAMLGEDWGDKDTLRASVEVDGDLLSSINKNVDSPIGGRGRGSARIAFFGVPGSWTFTTGHVSIPSGILKVKPFVLDDVKDFTFSMNIDSFSRVHTELRGMIKRRPIRIFSNHNIPYGYDQIQVGPLDFGILQVETPKQGVNLHIPGFMAVGEIGSIEFEGRRPLRKFTLSGPLEKFRITGTWILRDLEFTFPFLSNDEIPWEFDPFPYVSWDLDVRPGNRKVMYFWDLAGKRRRIMRFVEAYVDPASLVKVRGREQDKTFRLYGMARSYKGAAYYGKVFDRNVDIGVEFVPQELKGGQGYDNLPILWGRAEAFADTSRFDRIKLTCLVHNPLNNAVSERGRLVEGKQLNVSFHLSSDFEELPGESERDFYRQAGLTFTTLSGAGGLVSSFGEQYFHRYLLQRWERRLAKSVGLDVFNIESSIASNYFNKLYSRQFDGLVNQYDYLALANVGLTVGRYFFRDFLFLKARGELIPIDTVLTPEYSIGMEFQPSRFLTMDFNYGIHKGETDIEHNPKLNLQLRLPINRLRKNLKF